MIGDEQQQQQQPQQQPQRPPQPQQQPPQFSFHSVSQPQDSSTLVGSSRYQYKSKKLPPKPKVLEAGESLVTQTTGGGVAQFEDAS